LLELLKALDDTHKPLYSVLLTNRGLEPFLTALLRSGQSAIRIRGYEFLELIVNYYMTHVLRQKPDAGHGTEGATTGPLLSTLQSNQVNASFSSGFEGELVRHEQLVLAQLILSASKKSAENPADAYMQFNALVLLDLLFQSLLPVPSLQTELQRHAQVILRLTQI
jgi:hypothetical protein